MRIPLILLLSFASIIFLKLSPLTKAAEVPNLWIKDDALVYDLPDIGSYASPCIVHWTAYDWNEQVLIAGRSTGDFVSYYWTGSQWLEDSTYVIGLGNVNGTAGSGNYSSPTLGFNVTGDGNWTLISGRKNGDFVGYYLDESGNTWVADASRVAGLADVGSYSTPTLAYNFRSDEKWVLISGESNGGFFGYYWNGTRWLSDSTIVSGLNLTTGESRSHPCLAYNLIGGDAWTLISGGYNYNTYGFLWNGTRWLFEGLVVANTVWIGTGTYYATVPAVAYNVTGDDKWIVIYGVSTGVFYGFRRQQPSAGAIVETERTLMTGWEKDVYAVAENGTCFYLGTSTAPCKVAKIDKGTFDVAATLTLNATSGENHTYPDCMLVYGGYLYVGLITSNPTTNPSRIAKINLATFTKVSTLTLQSDEKHVNAIVTDGSFLYCAMYNSFLVRVNLTSFTRTDRISLTTTANALEIQGGYLYAALGWVVGQPTRVDKVDLSSFTKVATLSVDSLQTSADSVKSDGTWLYVGYTDSSGYLRRVNLSTFQNDQRLALGSGVYVDDMVVIGDNLFFLDAPLLHEVYLPSFSLGVDYTAQDTTNDICADVDYIYSASITNPATAEKFYFTGAVIHSVTIAASPSVNVRFYVDGILHTTPYTTNLPQGSHTFQVLDVFPKSGNFFLIYEYWTLNSTVDKGGAYGIITKDITSPSALVIHYHVGVLNLVFQDNFETGDLSKQSGTDLQSDKTKPGFSTCQVTSGAKYSGSYGLNASGVSGYGYGGHAFAYKVNTYVGYVYLNFMVYVPTGQTRGWFGLLRPQWLTMTLSETGATDTPDCTQMSVGWSDGNFEVVYWRGDLEYIKSDIAGFQFNKWFNITMFLKTSSDGLYALWVDGVLKWYRFHDDASLWGGYSSYIGARAWSQSKINFIDDEKIYTFKDPTFYTINVTSEPLTQRVVKIDGSPYTTPFTMLLEGGNHEIALVDASATIDDTPYAFTRWTVQDGATFESDSATFTLYVDRNRQLTAHFASGITLKPSEPVTPPPKEEAPYCFPMTFYIVMVVICFAGLYLYSQNETWKTAFLFMPVIVWLLLIPPCPPWDLYIAIILTIIAAALLINKARKK